jgi:hypothetical protein
LHPASPIVYIANVREVHRTPGIIVQVPIESETVMNPVEGMEFLSLHPMKCISLIRFDNFRGFFPKKFPIGTLAKGELSISFDPSIPDRILYPGGFFLCVSSLQG